MKKSFRLLILFLFALTVPFIAWNSAAQDNQSNIPSPQGQNNSHADKFRRVGKPIRDQYIVVLKSDTRREEVEAVADELLARHGGTTRHSYTHAIKGFSIQLPEAAAIALSHEPKVEYVQEDGQLTPTRSQSNASWGIDRIDQRYRPLNGNYNFANVNTGTGVQAYIIDSGLQFSHTEFRWGRTVNDVDFVGDGRNGNDCNGHGTFVAGLIGGTTFGVAKGIRLRSVRIMDCNNDPSTSRMIAGLDWVTRNHLKPAVATVFFKRSGIDYGLEDAIRGAVAAGVTVVVGAGNDAQDAKDTSPARIPEVITVGATNSDDIRANFSNFGSVLDLFAPGEGLTSASNQDLDHNGIFDDVTTGSGTSYAAALVVGVAARFLQDYPHASPAAVQGAIRNSATSDVVVSPGGSPNLLLYSEIHAAIAREASIPVISESDTHLDSGLDVGPNQWLALTGGGEIWAGVWFTSANGPQGWNSIEQSAAFPLPGSRPFSLLGILDQPFYIGRSNATVNNFTTPRRLYLRTNDDVPANGNGSFHCQAQVWKKLPDVSANFISQSVPNFMHPGQTYTASITMQNVGPTTWTEGQSYRLGSQADNTTWGITRVVVPHDVAPNGTVTFTFNITAPTTPGNHNFQWRMLQEGVQWFGDVTDNVVVTVLAPTNQAEFVSQVVPRTMAFYWPAEVSITMRNTGTLTWSAGSAYRLGSQNPQDNLRWGLNRVTLPHSVAPGETVTFDFTVTPPSTVGSHNFQWRMVQDGVGWFGQATPNVIVFVQRFCSDC